jgi:hypothetical protein
MSLNANFGAGATLTMRLLAEWLAQRRMAGLS